MIPRILLLSSLCHVLTKSAFASSLVPAESVASLYSFITSTTLAFPASTESSSDTQSFFVSNWGLSKGRVQNGGDDIEFVDDPFPNDPTPGDSSDANATGPVLQVTYPSGGYGSDSSGAQMYSLWNTSDTSSFESMLLSYEVAFDSGFDWVKGGKLPGLRGGPNPDGCSGGSNATDGSDCFSTRLMWRKDGEGEVYAYIPTSKSLCSEDDIICNSDFGTSIDRGIFSFADGQWNRITLLVRLNSPVDSSNGYVALYFNDVPAISQDGLQLRTSDAVTAGGLYFSTFYGGSDSSWAPSNTTHSYFRNFRLWGSPAASNLTASAATNLYMTDVSLRWTWLASFVVGTVISLAGLL